MNNYVFCLWVLLLVDGPGVASEQRLAVAQDLGEKKRAVLVVFGKTTVGDAGGLQARSGKRGATCALIGAVKRTIAVKCRP